MPTLVAASCSVSGIESILPAACHVASASYSAIHAPVIDAVRVPPSAWITSQSMVTLTSPPSPPMSTTLRSERPMSR